MADIQIALVADSNNPTVGDLYLKNGTVQLTPNLTASVAQELRIRFKFAKGEWFLDSTVGLPWYQSILGIKAPLGLVNQIFKNVITGCPGVKALNTFKLITNSKTRFATLSFSCTLNDGAILQSSDFAPFIPGS